MHIANLPSVPTLGASSEHSLELAEAGLSSGGSGGIACTVREHPPVFCEGLVDYPIVDIYGHSAF